MDYIQRLRPFSNKEVNRAAAKLISEPTDSDGFRQAMGLITDWRTLHEGPLVAFRPILEMRASEVSPNSLVFTRLKRIPTVIAKLGRTQKGMQLSTMQDIGGLRAVVNTVAEAGDLAERMSDVPPQFELKRPVKDYITNPARGGYRGLHLIYTYRSQSEEDRNIDGLKIELQIRTRLQHAWATAVEVVGTFRRESLKSGEGDPEWLDFFRLASDLAADREILEAPELGPDLIKLRDRLKVSEHLGAYGIALKSMLDPEVQEARYFVLMLNLENFSIEGHAFASRWFERAVETYRREEQRNIGNENIDVVLVAVESPSDLGEAYPNYFADTRAFVSLVYGGLSPSPGPSALEVPTSGPG